jgi:hypothetical protein
MDTVKIIGAFIIGGFLSSLQPLHGAMLVLSGLFFADVVLGIVTDLCINKNRFRTKKFIVAFAYLGIYLSIIASVFIIGLAMKDTDGALFIDKTLTYIFIYFYSANILGNLKQLFPQNRPIALLEYILHLEFIKRFQWLSDYLTHEKSWGAINRASTDTPTDTPTDKTP